MTSSQPSFPTRLDALRVLGKAERLSRARLRLTAVWTGAECANADWSVNIANLRRQLQETESMAKLLEKEEAKIRGALERQNALVDECLAAALKAFPAQVGRINLVNRAFSNAGALRRLQLRAVSWEKIWETLDPKWEPTPGLTLLGFRERRLELERESAEAGKVWMKWRMADEICQGIAGRIERDCMAWTTQAQRQFPVNSDLGRLVAELVTAV